MSGPLLTAAMIVRDEERFLAGCLDSLDGVVDEVVVVDTGSTDGSVAIARERGAEVLERSWDGDFAAARNLGLDAARGRWILYIDADERLRPVTRAAVEELLDQAPEVAFTVLFRPRIGYTPYREYRLWRNDPRIRFTRSMHERVVYAIDEVASADGRSIGRAPLAIDHLGYEGDQSHKHARDLPLLRARLAADPDDVYNLWHAGRILRATGDTAAAEEHLVHALELTRRDGGTRHAALALTELIMLRMDDGRPVDDLVREGTNRHPYNWRLVWLRARLHIAAGRDAVALRLLDRLLAVDPETLPDAGTAYDERLFGAFAHAARGECLFRLGRDREAAEAFAAAERDEPDRPEHGIRRRLAEARAAAG